MSFNGSLEFGIWWVRLGKLMFALKAHWNEPLFSERYRAGVRVLPLGFGWRITLRRDMWLA